MRHRKQNTKFGRSKSHREALIPMLVRTWRRRSRFDESLEPHEAVDRAWAELRDTWRDLGHDWPSGSPRTIASQLANRISTPDDRASLAEITRAVERSRYSLAAPDASVAAEQVRSLTGSLVSELSLPGRIKVKLLPRSVFFDMSTLVDSRRAPSAME